jgi:hypothetical protein
VSAHNDDHLVRGAGASNADAAPASPTARDRGPNTPPTSDAAPLGDGEKPDQLKDKDAENRQEALIDEGVEETFPASDPVSVKHIT